MTGSGAGSSRLTGKGCKGLVACVLPEAEPRSGDAERGRPRGGPGPRLCGRSRGGRGVAPLSGPGAGAEGCVPSTSVTRAPTEEGWSPYRLNEGTPGQSGNLALLGLPASRPDELLAGPEGGLVAAEGS